MAEEKPTRIVLLGKSGTGKSSLANTLFGEKLFEVGGLANSETHLCKSETRTVRGRNIQLIDTPGFFDTNKNNENLKEELLKCITEAAPGPHAFLLVFKVERFTPQEEEIVNLMLSDYFGEESLKYTTVVFTHGDQLKKGMKIEEWAKGNTALKNLLEKCQNRCCVFDNKYWKKNEDPYRNNQIKKLLDIIDQTVRDNGGRCYTNETLQNVQKQIEEKKQQLKQSSPNISKKSLFQKAKEFVCNLLKNNTKGVVIGAVLGAFLGGAAGVAVFGSACVKMGLAAGAGAVVGAVGGAAVSEYAEPVATAVMNVASRRVKEYDYFELSLLKGLKYD